MRAQGPGHRPPPLGRCARGIGHRTRGPHRRRPTGIRIGLTAIARLRPPSVLLPGGRGMESLRGVMAEAGQPRLARAAWHSPMATTCTCACPQAPRTPTYAACIAGPEWQFAVASELKCARRAGPAPRRSLRRWRWGPHPTRHHPRLDGDRDLILFQAFVAFLVRKCKTAIVKCHKAGEL